MCRNKFSSRIGNEIYCIMYCLNVTWSTLGGVVSFCAVFISPNVMSNSTLALLTQEKCTGSTIPQSCYIIHHSLDIPLALYKCLACQEVESSTRCLEVYSAASTHAVHLVLSVNMAFTIWSRSCSMLVIDSILLLHQLGNCLGSDMHLEYSIDVIMCAILVHFEQDFKGLFPDFSIIFL